MLPNLTKTVILEMWYWWVNQMIKTINNPNLVLVQFFLRSFLMTNLFLSIFQTFFYCLLSLMKSDEFVKPEFRGRAWFSFLHDHFCPLAKWLILCVGLSCRCECYMKIKFFGCIKLYFPMSLCTMAKVGQWCLHSYIHRIFCAVVLHLRINRLLHRYQQ